MSYAWSLAIASTPESTISTSGEPSPTFNFPDSDEEYVVKCSIVSECYSTTLELLFSPTNIYYMTPTFNFPINAYCQNETPNSLPLFSEEGIGGTWFPAAINTSTSGVFSYTFTPNQGECAFSITVDIAVNPIQNITFSDTVICEGDSIAFPNTNSTTGTWIPANLNNSNSTSYTFTPDTECAISSEWNVIVNQKERVYFADTTICEGETIPFPDTNNSTGTWSPATINNIQNGIYTFTPSGDCVLLTTWKIFVLEPLSNLDLTLLGNSTIVANVANATNSLIYQLDNGIFQSSNVFENVTNGCHTIYVTDLNGCSTLSSEVFVFNYPKFFTPNGDGYNDYWKIEFENGVTKLVIFDRYGKFLKQLQPKESSWDGTYNGQKLPATDYWFVLEYEECGVSRIFKSHFSLKR